MKILTKTTRDIPTKTRPVMIAQSGEAYDALVRSIESNNTRHRELSIVHERTKAQNTIMKGMLSKFLDEFEGDWDNDEPCDSPEIAKDYLDAAIYMQSNFGRTNNRIYDIQRWFDNYLPFGKK